MKKVKIKDIFHTNAKTIKSSKYDFINYLDTSSITENHINGVQKLYLKTDKIPSRAKRLIDKNTIVYSSVRPNLKHYGIIKKPLENMVVSTGFITLDIKDNTQNDANYMYYNLTQNKYTNYLHTIALNSVSAYPSINPSDLENIEIKIHADIKDQQKIGRFLSSIDDKIAINNQINEFLERTARAIYEYYFVQFDFPNKQGQPYKSSGGAMRFDPTLNRPIPKDFEVKKLADIIIKNTKKAEKDNKKSLIDLSVMPQNTFCLNLNNIGDAFNTNLFEMQKFDILFGSIRPYLKKAGFAPFDGLVTGTIHSVKPINPNFFNFILLTLTHKSFFDYAVSVSKGTKMPIIGYEELSDFKIPFNESIIEKFNTILNFKEIISNNIIQNQKLKNLRDFLLPLLINAQVQI